LGRIHKPLAGITFKFMMSVMAGETLTDNVESADVPTPDDPLIIKEALASPNAAHWKKALEKEHQNLTKHGVYKWAQSGDALVMDSKTILRMKCDTDSTITGFKVRCCAHGFTQIPGLHFDPAQGHAMVMQFETLHIVLAAAASQDATIQQFDVTSAYLHCPLHKTVYMKPPPGFEHPTDPMLVWWLLKPLYGTVQGGTIGRKRSQNLWQRSAGRSLSWT
jgi:Reverse transcriptase (RNA-dependent DNA polymerase)